MWEEVVAKAPLWRPHLMGIYSNERDKDFLKEI